MTKIFLILLTSLYALSACAPKNDNADAEPDYDQLSKVTARADYNEYQFYIDAVVGAMSPTDVKTTGQPGNISAGIDIWDQNQKILPATMRVSKVWLLHNGTAFLMPEIENGSFSDPAWTYGTHAYVNLDLAADTNVTVVIQFVVDDKDYLLVSRDTTTITDNLYYLGDINPNP